MRQFSLTLALLVAVVARSSAVAAESGGDDAFAHARRTHWALQPITRVAPPETAYPDWIRTPIDAFVLARLERAKLHPAPAARRRTLVRRATFDLLGLPPTWEEVQAFVHDRAPDAYARLIDRLLASPDYGERWGRHWLDVARYADTKGYALGREPRFPYAYTYRDYVIRAFNDDLPYDRFLVEQLAADRLPLGDDARPLAALGFLTVGRRFLGNRHEIIDDQIDVVSRGLLGLTVGCARCHDHKYDPIPTEDYYSLYGVFASAIEPAEAPLLGEPADTPEYRAFKSELDKRAKALDAFVAEKHAALLGELRTRVGDYLVKLVVKDEASLDGFALSLSPGEARPQVVARWRAFLARTAEEHHPVFAPWHRFAALPAERFADEAKRVIAELTKTTAADAPMRVNALLVRALADKPPTSMPEVAQRYGTLFASVHKQWEETRAATGSTATPNALPDAAAEELRQVLYAPDMPAALTAEESKRLFDRATRNRLVELKRNVDQWKVTAKGAPPRAMSLVDAPNPYDPAVFLRGKPNRKGKPVPRRFLRLLAGADAPTFQEGSGRLELARAITSSDNPLTARVFVNRVWMHHFGTPLVETPSNFGTQTPPPTHPALLDDLARRFMDGGWSIKKLHRLIMLSATYRQASVDRPDARAADPENRLLWRMNRRRLEFEAMRDSLLAVAGRLDTTPGGPSVDLVKAPFTRRRSVYGFIDRQDLPGLFRVFDFASPDASTPKRPKTTVPQQALFMMNSPFVTEQARHLAARAEGDTTEQRLRHLHRLALAREPSAHELARAARFLDAQAQAGEAKTLPRWVQYAQVLLLTNEFVFVD